MAQIYRMLEEIIHPCSKCKLDLNHRITLMDGDKPARVLCLTCNTERAFKDPEKAVRKLIRTATTTKLKSAVRAAREEDTWVAALRAGAKTPKRYDTATPLAKEDHVHHVKFGLGLVVETEHPDKLHIYFESAGMKVLKGLLL